ncbi:hypothetical protein GFY24_17380 [Nocardia sp. SYP-A9097]|uniref:hypothetical protein n=1 Tax=Nocardia sp. SYP-A9097 TaxID=2663237 RepID=UPI0013235762|nr:hypothetical protein [Nocardia sp. SYP-A9097]MRH89200.1 hypothetical protein [Nocardia sp. SYP-A9097]
MNADPTAIGYLRADVSGPQLEWDKRRIRRLAKRLGYALLRIVVFAPQTDDMTARLVNVTRHLHVDAVIVPSVEHFDGAQAPVPLVQAADVICGDSEHTEARWFIPPLPIAKPENRAGVSK